MTEPLLRRILERFLPRIRGGAGLGLLAGLTLWLALVASAGPASSPRWGDTPTTTAPEGASVLARMGLSLDRTSLGRIGFLGTEPPEAIATHTRDAEGSHWMRDGFVLDGRDLYRFSCRACHGQGGQGLPPEIRPLTEKVRDTSVRSVEERQNLSEAAAREVADRAQLELLHRLEEGGTLMPPFTHLTDREIEVLRGYLEALAGLSEGSRSGLQIAEPPDRVGELVVKGTCQICHDATADAARRPIYDRAIPPLASIPERYPAREFLRKARSGMVKEHGPRGRMPQLGFLSDEELTAAYFYLTTHPPR